MRLRPRRRPALETAVFAAALVLAAFIARELWVRQSPVTVTTSVQPAALNPAFPPLPLTAPAHRTEHAVAGVASIKLTRVQRRKPKPAVVPAPK